MANPVHIDAVFARLPDPVLRPWLLQEREQAYRTLINASDPRVFHQAQGMAQLVERMLSALDKARSSS